MDFCQQWYLCVLICCLGLSQLFFQVSFNFVAAVTVYTDSGAQENKICHCFQCFPIYLPWSDGTGCHDLLSLLNLSFKPGFLLSSFTLIKRLFSSSLLSPLEWYHPHICIWLLIFLPAILIPACDSSSPIFHRMYSAQKAHKQGANIQPCRTPCPDLNWSLVPYMVLIVAS